MGTIFNILKNAAAEVTKELGRRVKEGAEKLEQRMDTAFPNSIVSKAHKRMSEPPAAAEAPQPVAAAPAAAPAPAALVAAEVAEPVARTATPAATEAKQTRKAPPPGMRYCACGCGGFTADRPDRPFVYSCFKRESNGQRKPAMEKVDRLGNPLPEPMLFPRQVTAPRRDRPTQNVTESERPAPQQAQTVEVVAVLSARRCDRGADCVEASPDHKGKLFQPLRAEFTTCPACHRKAREPQPLDRAAAIASLVSLTGHDPRGFEACTDKELLNSLEVARFAAAHKAQQNRSNGQVRRPSPLVEVKAELEGRLEAEVTRHPGASSWRVGTVHIRRSPKSGAQPGDVVFLRVPVNGKYVDVDGHSRELERVVREDQARKQDAAIEAANRRIEQTIAAQRAAAKARAEEEARYAKEQQLMLQWSGVVEAQVMQTSGAGHWELETDGMIITAVIENADACKVRVTLTGEQGEESFSYVSDRLLALKPVPVKQKGKKGEGGDENGKKGKKGGKGKK